ncbi:transcriptional regulator FeaR [Pseudomonas aeruginosa]|uniref:transcriptional regulator FeaR n=1 Tax=Pseudomonas aeruginosa TaxID=287 RepID=UPI0005904517|nr:transcriptional regulator FeaR [Pseudomonas aeruginosa]
MHTLSSAHNSFEAWNQALRHVCGRFESQPALNRTLFIGDISRQDLGGLELAQIRTNAGRIARQATHADHDDDRHCFLVVQRSGHAQLRQGGDSIELAPGEMALMDSAGGCEIIPHGLIEHTSFHLSREEVCRHLPPSQRAFGKLSPNCASGRLLSLLVQQVCAGELQPWAVADEGGALQEALIALLGPALQHAGEELEGPLAGLYGYSLRRHAERLIEQSLQEPRLSPDMLAGRLRISVRQLYRLFEEQGDSVCRYILRQRLSRSAADLGNPRLRGESITSIAFKWGFSDSAHFSRAFKKQFEVSPKDYRAGALPA